MQQSEEAMERDRLTLEQLRRYQEEEEALTDLEGGLGQWAEAKIEADRLTLEQLRGYVEQEAGFSPAAAEQQRGSGCRVVDRDAVHLSEPIGEQDCLCVRGDCDAGEQAQRPRHHGVGLLASRRRGAQAAASIHQQFCQALPSL